MKGKTKIALGLLVMVIVASPMTTSALLNNQVVLQKNTVSVNESVKEGSYADYLEQHPFVANNSVSQTFSAVENVSADMELTFANDQDGAYVKLPEDGKVNWTIMVKKAGLYTLALNYCPTDGNSSNIQRTLYVNGTIPYNEAKDMTFHRLWVNKTEIQQDLYGNDIRPLQIENPKWMMVYCQDADGYVTKPLTIYLNEGKNVLSLDAEREAMLLRSLTIATPVDLPDYKTVQAADNKAGYAASSGKYIQIEGENAKYKSSPTLYPLSDTSTSSTEPYEPSRIKLNTIGGSRWSYVGDYLEWQFDVPQDGLYQIAVKARQNVTSGLVSTRRITIDGKLPFSEMNSVAFYYDSDWQMVVLGDGKLPYAFNFKQGTHTIRMEVTLGNMGQILGVTQEVLAQLNQIYRDIIMITGTSPDTMRDYRLNNLIPETIENITEQCGKIKSVQDNLESYTGQTDGNAAILATLIRQMSTMYKNPSKIADNLSYFKTNIGSLGTWVNDMCKQNLEIDYIAVYSPDVSLKSPTADLWSSLLYQLRRFADAFVIDYNQIGNVIDAGKDKTITVWSSAGRDQMQTLKTMLNDSFTQETGIGVNLELVDDGTLLPATVAGIGPDVVLGTGQSTPVDYALRDAICPLEKFDTYKNVAARFSDTLMVPYRLDNHVYALPETLNFPVLYYRTDILKKLGVDIPKTWNDVISLTTVLSNNNMSFGFPYSTTANPGGGLSLFYSLLMQNGGQVYVTDGSKCSLDSDVSVSTFKMWTNFYLNYGQQLEVDFVNRFRTGEIPVGIASQTVYNSLAVAAPEIKNLWGFTVIPGKEMENGTLDHTNLISSTCCIILESSNKKEMSWDFLDWWTREDIQLRFGREMESVLGASARYPTANLKAYESLSWKKSEWGVLEEAISEGKCVPEIPGGYFTSRHINNAFRSVVLQKMDVKDTLLDYVDTINQEITYKRQEFGIK